SRGEAACFAAGGRDQPDVGRHRGGARGPGFFGDFEGVVVGVDRFLVGGFVFGDVGEVAAVGAPGEAVHAAVGVGDALGFAAVGGEDPDLRGLLLAAGAQERYAVAGGGPGGVRDALAVGGEDAFCSRGDVDEDELRDLLVVFEIGVALDGGYAARVGGDRGGDVGDQAAQ